MNVGMEMPEEPVRAAKAEQYLPVSKALAILLEQYYKAVPCAKISLP